MNTRNLAAKLVTLRGGNSQTDAVLRARGEGADTANASSAGPINWYNKLETAFGSGATQIKKRPNNLTELKRLVRKYNGNVRGWAGILGTYSGR